MGEHRHPEISMHTHCLADYMDSIRRGDWEPVADLMLDSSRKLAGCGAEILICPDNTVHQVFEQVREASPLPWIHIATAVVEEAQRNGFSKLGVLGTRYLMEGPVYRAMLESRDIAHEIPAPDDRERIDRIIFDELVNGRILESSRSFFHEVIERLGARGCDAVVLGCTEIPLIVRNDESSLPGLDSTRLLARAALRQSLRQV